MANITMSTTSNGGGGGRNTTTNTSNNNSDTPMLSLPRPTNDDTQERLTQIDKLKYFLATATNDWDPERAVKSFGLPTGESVSCVFWNHLFHITGTDIVRCLVFRFHAFGRPVCNLKKFEEGVFSDLRNLKPGNDACLEEPKSEFLDMLYKNNCIRTQKKQKVFYWFSVPHDRLFLDALERDLKREKIGVEPTSMAVADPASSLSLDSTHELFDQLRKSMALSAAATAHALEDEAVVSSSTGRSHTTSLSSNSSHANTNNNGDPHRHANVSNADDHDDMMTDDDEWTGMTWTSTCATEEATLGSEAAQMNSRTWQSFPTPPARSQHQQKSRSNSNASLSHEYLDTQTTMEPISHAINKLDLTAEDNTGTTTTTTTTAKQHHLRRKSKALIGMVSLFEGSATYKQRRRRAASLSSTPTTTSSSTSSSPIVTTPHHRHQTTAPSSASSSTTLLSLSSSSGGPIRHHHRSTSNPDLMASLPQHQQNNYNPSIVFTGSHQVLPTSSTSSPLIQKPAPPLLSTTSYNALASATNALANMGDDGSDPNRTYTCPLGSCGRLFKRLEHLKRHLRTHTMERPYLCQQCGKRFSRSDNLAQHRKTHDRSRLHHSNQQRKDDQDGSGNNNSHGNSNNNSNGNNMSYHGYGPSGNNEGSSYGGGNNDQQGSGNNSSGSQQFPPHQQWPPHLGVPSATASNSLCSSRSSTMSPMRDPDWDFYQHQHQQQTIIKQEPDWSCTSSPTWQQPMFLPNTTATTSSVNASLEYHNSKLAMMHLQHEMKLMYHGQQQEQQHHHDFAELSSSSSSPVASSNQRPCLMMNNNNNDTSAAPVSYGELSTLAFPPEDISSSSSTSFLASDYNSQDFVEFYNTHAPLIPTTFVNDYLVDQV